MDDWLSKEWADHRVRFSAGLSTDIAEVVIRLRSIKLASFRRRRTHTHG